MAKKAGRWVPVEPETEESEEGGEEETNEKDEAVDPKDIDQRVSTGQFSEALQ